MRCQQLYFIIQQTSASAIRHRALLCMQQQSLSRIPKTLPALPSLPLASDTMRPKNPNDKELGSILSWSLAYEGPTSAAVRRWASGASQY
jgi:hypothetical protein